MADASKTTLQYSEETAFAETPSTPNMTLMRFTGESLQQEQTTVTSSELRSDAQTPDVIRTGVSASGDVNIELSYAAFDDFFEAVLRSTDWSTENIVIASSSDVSVVSGVITLNVGTWTNTPAVGSWLEMRGWTTTTTDATNNNGYFRVSAATTTTVSIDLGSPVSTLVDKATGIDTITIDELGHVTSGTTFRSFLLERKVTNRAGTDKFSVFYGMVADSFSLNVNTEAVITGSITFLGKSEFLSSNARPTSSQDATPNAAPTNSIMNAVDHVNAVIEGSTVTSVTSFSINSGGNARSLLEVGTLGATDVGQGTHDVNGTLQLYFEDDIVVNKYLSDTATALAIIFEDAAGNGYVMDMPAVKYSSAPTNATGQNTDMILDAAYIAYRDSTLGYTLRIARFTA